MKSACVLFNSDVARFDRTALSPEKKAVHAWVAVDDN